MHNCSEVSFLDIHKKCKKCTPDQIMSYQSSIQLYKTLNNIFSYCSTEHASLLNNITCTRRQLKFEIVRSNRTKIGMNMISNKFYHILKQIGLDLLNLRFAHFKKLMKIQFLKYGKTWNLLLNIHKMILSWYELKTRSLNREWLNLLLVGPGIQDGE